MRLAILLLALSMLYGCMPNECLSAAAASETNVYHISLLKSGMNQVQVLKIMRHPYSDQVYYLDEDIFDVWFYVTGNVVLGQSRMMPMNLTPLVFKNGILVGWGNGVYNMVKSRDWEAERAKLLPPPAVPIQERGIEDKELERSLEKTLQPQSAKPAAPGPSPTLPPQKQGPGPSLQSPPPKKKPAEKGGAKQGTSSGAGTPVQKGETPAQQSAPNWSPLEKQKPEQPQTPSPQKPSSTVTMTRSEEKGEEDRLPLNEEDEEMLQDERKYDFDQTKNSFY